MSPPDPAVAASDLDALQSQFKFDELEQAEQGVGDVMQMQGEFGNDAVSTLLDEGGGVASGPDRT